MAKVSRLTSTWCRAPGAGPANSTYCKFVQAIVAAKGQAFASAHRKRDESEPPCVADRPDEEFKLRRYGR